MPTPKQRAITQFNAEEFAALRALSEQYGVSISYLIRHFLRYSIKALESGRLTLFDIVQSSRLPEES
jgi:hypothetical protein